MADGFRIAGAFVEVNLKDNTQADEAKLRARLEKSGPVTLETALNDPDNVRVVKERIQAGTAAKIRTEVDKPSLAKTERDVESATERVAQRANAQFSALQFGAAFAGLPAAAAVAGAGVAAGLSAAPLAFAALAVEVLKSNAAVKTAATDMSSHVTSSVTAMAQPLEGTMVLALNRLGTGFDRLAPQIGTAMRGSGAALLTFEDGVIGLAQNAMPGLVTAVQNSQAPMEGLRSLLLSAGTGASDFFRNLSQGAQSSQGIMTTTGSIIKDLEGFAGSLFANLSNGGGPALTSFRQALSSVEGALVTVTSSGSPVLGFLQGFTTSISGGLSVVQMFAGLLNLLPPGLSQLAGSTFAVVKVLDTFGVSAKTAFDGFGSAISNAEGARAKFSAGITGLASAAMNPAMLATAGLSIGLMALGQEQEKAAQAAQIHDSYLQSLTSALRASGGAIDDNVRQQAAQALSNSKVADTGTSVLEWAKSMHLSLPLVTDAALGVPGALDQVHAATNAYAQSAGGSTQVADTFTAAINNIASSAPAAKTAIEAEATAHGTAAAAIGKQLSALLQLNDALLATADKDFAYAQAQTALQAAHDAVTKAIQNKTSTTLQITQAEQGEEGAMLSLIHASEAKAAADYKGTDAGEKSRQTMAAAAIEALQLAGQYGSNLPSSVSHYIASLDNAQLSAMGVTRSIDNFGNSVYHLPDGKDIKIGADTTGAWANVKGFKDFADATTAQTTVGANIDPATQRVLDWKNTTYQTVGNTTTYTNTDPATGQVRNWKVVTDQTGAQTTTYSTTNPATGQVDTFIRDTNGKWSTVNVGANTGSAQGTLARFYDSYIHDVTVNVNTRVAGPGVGLLQGANIVGGGAHGGITIPGFAEGGITAYAAGGLRDLVPMSSLASMVPPNSWRVIGDNQRVPEAFIPVDPGSKRSQDLLSETNAMMGRTQATTSVSMPIHITTVPMDPHEMANAVSAAVTWNLRR